MMVVEPAGLKIVPFEFTGVKGTRLLQFAGKAALFPGPYFTTLAELSTDT
jgi:hypothetical protein